MTQISRINSADAARWRQGWLVYRNEPLRYVVADLSRYSNVRIELAPPPQISALAAHSTATTSPNGLPLFLKSPPSLSCRLPADTASILEYSKVTRARLISNHRQQLGIRCYRASVGEKYAIPPAQSQRNEIYRILGNRMILKEAPASRGDLEE